MEQWVSLCVPGSTWFTEGPSRGAGCVPPPLILSCSSDLNEELTEQAYVNVLTRGDLSSLRWIASPLRHFVTSSPDVQLCRVYYSSLNFRDVMLATGKLPPDAIPGGWRPAAGSLLCSQRNDTCCSACLGDLALQQCMLGMEFSGRDPAGQRVMGLLPARGLATSVDADKRFLWAVPSSWSVPHGSTCRGTRGSPSS